MHPVPKIPVSVYYEGIPGKQWEAMFGPDYLKCTAGLARSIEYDLRRRIWMAENVPDDHIVWPTVVVAAPKREQRGWGVELGWKHADSDLGANAYDPPFKDGVELHRLTKPVITWDEEELQRQLEHARHFTGGKLTVFPNFRHVSHAPFDYAVQMRGMENLLMDVALQPGTVHALMEFITSWIENVDRERERAGRLSVFPSPGGWQEYGFRIHCAWLTPDFTGRKPALRDEWVYLTDQTSAGLGPDQYAEFIQPYHARLAAPYTNTTIYYHGCECLDLKGPVIKKNPNLRRFHVSPWSSVAKAVETFRGSVVMEVHDHPGNTFLKSDAEMQASLRKLVDAAAGHPMDLNISDIHTFDGKPQNLVRWARAAQAVAGG
ncbi:MAG: hypothetical protein ABIF71_12820 [Planctomycetota bacterium]